MPSFARLVFRCLRQVVEVICERNRNKVMLIFKFTGGIRAAVYGFHLFCKCIVVSVMSIRFPVNLCTVYLAPLSEI